MKSQIVKTSKGPIEYMLQGGGPVVLVCHGTSANCFSTEALHPLVGAGFQVLTPSRPGYGRTPLKVGRSSIEVADALIALVDALGIQNCSVAAISGGGPTGIALASKYPERVQRLALIAAISKPEDRLNEPSYKNQMAFYGPLHNVYWSMLKLVSNLSPRNMARQTLALFSTHDPDDALRQISADGIGSIRQFYQGKSSRQGALNDATHTVGKAVLQAVNAPTLVIHSREDRSVPFSHAEWSMQNIPNVELCEAGVSGHFFWIDPGFDKVCKRLIAFLRPHMGAS